MRSEKEMPLCRCNYFGEPSQKLFSYSEGFEERRNLSVDDNYSSPETSNNFLG